MDRKRVGILIFDDVEVLDFCGPFEVFSVARLDEARRLQERSPFEVLLVAETPDLVTASGGMRVLPDVGFEDCPELDILVVPGGMGARREMANEVLLGFLQAQAGTAEIVASVCTGSLLLGKAGLLEGRRATTHWASLDLLRQLFPGIQVDASAHVVDEGRILTSAGISAGIDLALRIVARCCGEEVARAAAHRMEYPFPEGNGRRVRLGGPRALPRGLRRPPVDVAHGGRPLQDPRGGRPGACAWWSTPRRCRPTGAPRGTSAASWTVNSRSSSSAERSYSRPGDGVFIPDGPEHRHRARTLTDTVTALFVESV